MRVVFFVFLSKGPLKIHGGGDSCFCISLPKYLGDWRCSQWYYPSLRLGSFGGKKIHMLSWLLRHSLFLKQMYSVHYFGASALWSFQKCPVKMPTWVVRVVCLQLVENQISVPKFFFKKRWCLVANWYLLWIFLSFYTPCSPPFVGFFGLVYKKIISPSLLETISV